MDVLKAFWRYMKTDAELRNWQYYLAMILHGFLALVGVYEWAVDGTVSFVKGWF